MDVVSSLSPPTSSDDRHIDYTRPFPSSNLPIAGRSTTRSWYAWAATSGRGRRALARRSTQILNITSRPGILLTWPNSERAIAKISFYPRSRHASRSIGCTERRYAIERPRTHELSFLRLPLWSTARKRRIMRRRPSLTSRMVRLRRSSVFQLRPAIRSLSKTPCAIAISLLPSIQCTQREDQLRRCFKAGKARGSVPSGPCSSPRHN